MNYKVQCSSERKKLSCCKRTRIRFHECRNYTEPKVITRPGNYVVCGNVSLKTQSTNITMLTIASSNVTLDLCGYTLKLENGQNFAGVVAISVLPDLSNVSVHNGNLEQFSGGGIVAGDPTGVNTSPIHNLRIEEIKTSNVGLNAVALYQVVDLTVSELHSNGSAQGERLLLLDNIQTGQITRAVGTGFTSTLGSILEINSCSNVRLQSCEVNNNTKAIVVASPTIPNQQMCILSINNSSNIDVISTRVNSNNNITSVTEGITFVGVFRSSSVQFLQSEMQSNLDVAAGSESYTYGFQADYSDDLVIRQCQWSYNGASAAIQRFVNIDLYNCNNFVIEDTLSDYITVPALSVVSTDSNLHGIYATGSTLGFAGRFTRCSTSFISCATAGAGRTSSNFAYLAGLHTDIPAARVEGHYSCFNSFGDNQPWTEVEGMEVGGYGGATSVVGCVSCFNTGGQEAYGLCLDYDGPAYSDASKQVINSILDFNGNYGLDISFPDDTDNAAADIQIHGCSMNNNGANVNSTGVNIGAAAGIFLRQLTKGLSNIVISNCDIIDNSSSDPAAGNSYGICANGSSNVTIRECRVIGTGSTVSGDLLVGHGILLDGCANVSISGCTIQGNRDSGVEMDGTNTGIQILDNSFSANDIAVNQPATSSETACTVRGNQAVNNVTGGFVHLSPNLQTAFFQNVAQGNGAASGYGDFVLATGQVIQLQSLTVSTAVTTSLFGTMSLGAYLTNLQVLF